MQLSPCPSCKRHVAIDAASCPFCAIALAPASPAVDPGRLSRAAVFAFGAATLASTALGACWTNKSEPQHVQQHTTAVPDAAVAAQPDAAAAPQPDAAVVQKANPNWEPHYQNHPCYNTPQGPVCAPYGAPPARRRVV